MDIQNILAYLRRAVTDYDMISDGDKIAIGVSGGKDSITLALALKAYQRFSKERFELEAINIDLGFENTDKDTQKRLQEFIKEIGIPYTTVKTDIGDIVFNTRKEKNPCSLCSKMRRGSLCAKAVELNCNKVALGHHADDLVETFFLSLIYEGRLSTFQAKSFLDRTGVTIIRPLLYMHERDIVAFTKSMPILKNPCPADKNTKRQYMKQLIKSIKTDIPFADERIFSAITNTDRQNLITK